MKNIIKKQTSQAFNKNIYLLGTDKGGIKYWLKAPSFDCGWYWGFGYVEAYTNNDNPSIAKDIISHQHISKLVDSKYEGTFINNIYDCPLFDKITFSEKEGWNLSELFKQFYLLREMADFTHKKLPGCHVAASPVNHGDLTDWNKQINEVMVPKVTKAIIEILTPKESDK